MAKWIVLIALVLGTGMTLPVQGDAASGKTQGSSDEGRCQREAAEQGAAESSTTSPVRAGDAEDCQNYFSLWKVAHQPARALAACRRLADKGDAQAQYTLGFMYRSSNECVPRRDFAEALTWYRRAAEQEYAPAQSALGEMYRVGFGVAQDFSQALNWFHKAAAQGDARAMFSLGVMYSMARGVAQDNVQAYMWYDLAASRGEKLCAKFRDEVALKMTSGQIVQAKALVAAWKPTTVQ